jgi:FAD/FMN-containing dehydrogenase
MSDTKAMSDATISIPRLRAEVTGRVIGPQDAGYDRARTIFPGGIDRRPAVIIRAADAADVAYAVSLAGRTGLDLAVRGGGHSIFGVCDDGIVLDLSAMRGLDIDPQARTAAVEPGVTAGEYTVQAAKYGLATGFGDTGSVGVTGLTLGGGVGYLVRKHGLTIDDLLAAELVTADGRLVRADAEQHPDLFWAIRGGGGNFGVVTRLWLRLHPVDTVVGGMLLLPATPEVIAGFMAAAQAAPDELSAIANVMPAPPMPDVPTERHGELVVLAMIVYAGEQEEGLRAVAPFRALAEPIADLVRPMAYPEIYPPDGETYHPMAAGRTLFADGFDAGLAATILKHLRASAAPMRVAQLRVLGGAVARVPNDATAFAHRDRRIMVNLAALYEDPRDRDDREAWVGQFAQAVVGEGTGAYVNFLNGDGATRIREAYPGATWDRLVDVKRRYDPTNLFRLNQNIPPGRAQRSAIPSA